MKRIICILALSIIPYFLFSSDNYISSVLINNELHILLSSGTYVIRPYTAEIIQVAYFQNNIIVPDTSYSRVLLPQNPSTVLDSTSSYLMFSTDSVEVLINKSPFQIMFISNGDTLLKEINGFTVQSGSTNIDFSLDASEMIYGTGSRAIDINRNNQKLTMYNQADGDYVFGANQLNICMPFITSSKGYGLYAETSWPGYWDIGSTNSDVLEYGADDGSLSYFFVGGTGYANIISNYAMLTGLQPLPPRWALGYIQSKYGYHTTQEAQTIVDTLQDNHFPLDAIVLDLYWYGSSNLMGNYSWDYSSFPDPVAMMSGFKSRGVKTILISEPYFQVQCTNYNYANRQKYFGLGQNNRSYVLNYWIGNCSLLDMTDTNATNWLWTLYKPRIDEGVSSWWTDLGEPELQPYDMKMQNGPANKIHDVYSLLWQKLLYENYRKYYPTQRLFNLSRSGYAGMQRYSTHPWSGDIDRSFEGLKAQIPIILGMGVCGVGYMHCDMGGFSGSNTMNDELYTRWLEFGSFAPIMRAHGTGIPTEPTAFSVTTQQIVRKYSQLRYQLLPYNYSLAYENSTKGLPLMRTTDFYNAKNNLLTNLNDQYLWGRDMLVAPVIRQGQTSRSVVFPDGMWIDYDNNASYPGNSIATVDAPLNDLPLFVRAGSFLPMVNTFYSTDYYHTDSLFVKYYPDASVTSSTFTMYDDDGHTPDANLSGQYQLLSFTGAFSVSVPLGNGSVHLSATGNGYTGMPSERQMYFNIQRVNSIPGEILHDKTTLSIMKSYTDFKSSTSEGYWLDSLNERLYVHIGWSTQTSTDVFFTEALSVNNIVKKNDSKFAVDALYPNPVQNNLNVTISSVQPGNFTLSVYSLDGKLLISQPFNTKTKGNSTALIDTSILSDGLYFLSITDRQSTVSLKFVKL